MEYNAPVGAADPDDPYIDGNPATGTAGSAVPAAAIEDVQREIVNAILAAGIDPDDGDLSQLAAAIIALAPASPAGSMAWWPVDAPPAGSLVRDGSAISRVTYSDLYTVLGTDYGVGDGATTFNLPDDRANAIRGWDDGRGIDVGRVFGSEQLDAIQNIIGSFHVDVYSYSADGAFSTAGGSNAGQTSGSLPSHTDFDASRVVRTADETRMRNRAYLPIIKY